jgi:hypothetical protein
MPSIVLWAAAAVLAGLGFFQILKGKWILGIAFVVMACAVGPGGYALFSQGAI